jgi:translocator protein
MTPQSTIGQVEKPKFKWGHAAIILIVANLLSAAPAGYNGEEAFYNNFVLPKLSPPDWAFAPAWLFNNITSLIALYIIANLPKESKEKTLFLWLEGISWVLFAIFSIGYFGLKSPILGAIDTVLGLIATAISFYYAYQLNKKAAWYILPRLLWLILATYVSVYVAVVNKDVFFSGS